MIGDRESRGTIADTLRFLRGRGRCPLRMSVQSYPVAGGLQHTPGGFKHHTFIPHNSGDQKSELSITGLRSWCQSVILPLAAPGDDNLFLARLASGGYLLALACGHTTSISASVVTMSSLLW